MLSDIRKDFNSRFTVDKYKSMIAELDKNFPGAIQFRLAETPVFVSKELYGKMISACEAIIDLVLDPLFLKHTENSIPVNDKVAGTYGLPQTIAFDFGMCNNNEGQLDPQLVEMQGFPSLYGFQAFYPDILKEHFEIPEQFSQYLGNHDRDSYTTLLKQCLLGNHDASEVILLEIKPHDQKTRVDFYCTRDMTGIQPVCITELQAEGSKLFYKKDGKNIPVKRIYNRVIFDELHQRNDLGSFIDIRKAYDVEWVPHPDWFYRISKYTLPLINHPNVPETFFLNEIKQLPGNLNEFVLKPLFSFAGQGVVIDVEPQHIEAVKDPHNWILQKKVRYADIVPTPDVPAKVEIRIMYLWKDGAARPEPAINLARLSKGKMIGTRYNKDHEWVGGSVAFIER